MKQVFKYLLVASLFVSVLAGNSLLNAADPAAKSPDKAAGRSKEASEPTKPKRDWYPFGGIVSSVNKQANTISLKKKEGERVLKVDAKSTLEIEGKPATIGTVKAGTYAHGKLHKDSAGHEVITDAKFDKEPPSKTKESVEKERQSPAAPKSK